MLKAPLRIIVVIIIAMAKRESSWRMKCARQLLFCWKHNRQRSHPNAFHLILNDCATLAIVHVVCASLFFFILDFFFAMGVCAREQMFERGKKCYWENFRKIAPNSADANSSALNAIYLRFQNGHGSKRSGKKIFTIDINVTSFGRN